ncbi:MAG: dipeptide epimerase [Planctomycetota bacterium]|nr:MAG: dipeptide epimerase [Planctomycetota bacterium]
MIKLSTHEFKLPLRHVFSISRESTSVQPTLIVELSDGEHRGYGEATSNKYYGATIESMREALESVRAIVEGTEQLQPERLWEQTWPLLEGNPFAECALDEAAHDLWGKQQGAAVYELWGLSTERVPQSNFTIGIDAIEVMVQKLLEMPGWPIYKIKLGTKHDLDIVRELRKHTDATFRVDANCGWSADEAIANSHVLAGLGVEFIEQPLPAADWAGAKQVYEKSALPIVADESCIAEGDVERCVGHFHGVNVKLVKCGGLTPARRMVLRARELGMKAMVGCMTESTVGISAIAQLLPLLDYVDMDGAALLASDIAAGVVVERGTAIYPPTSGCGVELTAVNRP